jgi:hypothetical protein
MGVIIASGEIQTHIIKLKILVIALHGVTLGKHDKPKPLRERRYTTSIP